MDSDDEREENIQWKGVPGTILLINGLNSSIATSAHAAVSQVIRQYLREGSNHHISVCFYGLQNATTSSIGLETVVEIIPFSVPTLDDFKMLLNFKISDYEKVKELKLSEPLWLCSKMFASCKKQLSSRTVIIITKLDVPPVRTDYRPTCTRVTDLVNSNVDIKIINISDTNYVVDSFYEDFAVDANVTVPEPVWEKKEIENLVYQQSHRHMAVAQLTFTMGNGFDIGVGIYKLIKSSTYLKAEKLDEDTNAVLTTVNKTMKVTIDNNSIMEPMDENTDNTEKNAQPLLKSEIVNYLEYGGERIEFTEAEKKALVNSFGPPKMKLLGFKPAKMILKEKWYLKPGYFLYPNENVIEGSTVAFKALYQACLELSVVAICVLSTRVNSRPNIVALSPCSKPLDLDVEIGFDVIHIPFVENIRNVPALEEDDLSTKMPIEHKEFMKDIVSSLQFDYKADKFENPKLQTHYRNIEAIALMEENVEPFVDTTKPNPEIFQNLKEDIFEELFGPFRDVPLKRVMQSKEFNGRSKKPKEDIDEELLQNRIIDKQINKYTVDQLKQILRSKEIPELPALTGLKKTDLVDLVYKYLA